MKYRNEIGVLFTVALMLYSLAHAGANELLSYGGQALGAEASGFDALAFQIFGDSAGK